MDLKIKKAKNTMGTKYLSFNEAKAKIASLNLNTRREYIAYVQSNNINYLPLQAEVNYSKRGWAGFADFLGITEAQYKANKQNQWADVVKTRKPYTKPVKLAKTSPVIAPKPVKLIGLDPDKVIQFLITEDVAPETIVKMVAELDIKSSTLMNDLCKYMRDKSKHQAEVWRPTGYNTAEAQLSIKI
jgi:hypothetical protein